MADDTPMMKQYREIKARYPGTFLFFRLGDFYEMFGEDARQASALLQLTLTQRSGVPMCGVPHHASETYIKRLLQAGKKIAVCEQVNPENAHGKGLFERKVTGILTPGTVTSDELLGQQTANYTLSLFPVDDAWGLAAWDASTGEILAGSFQDGGDHSHLQRELERLRPKEAVYPEGVADAYPGIRTLIGNLVREELPPAWFVEPPQGADPLCGILLAVAPQTPEYGALLGLGRYLVRVLGHPSPYFSRFISLLPGRSLTMDASTLRNLELVEPLDASSGSSLYQVMNCLKTYPGQRRLKRELTTPPRELGECHRRLTETSWYFDRLTVTRQVRTLLEGGGDWERILGRLKLGRASPADLGGLGNTLEKARELSHLISEKKAWSGDEVLFWMDELNRAIHPQASRKPTEGPRLADGFHPELDRWRHLSNHGLQVLERVRQEESKSTGLPLKLKENKVNGYYFELTRLQAQQVPGHFIRKQSLAGAERFTTERLAQAESELAEAAQNAENLERDLFLELRNRAAEALPLFQSVGEWLTEVDFHSGLAWAAVEKNWSRPELVEEPLLEIVGGRHPVVEAFLPLGGYVPNDLTLSGVSPFRLVTGPNMAGKSTYLRQTALLVVLAHLGSYVPAEKAVVGLADKVFCRVGASDNLARGASTFLVEMKETAHIIRTATPRSLVIMDEVGRGTGTEDGLALAWAVSEFILTVLGCRTLFSTHYHELTDLCHPSMANLHMEVEERGADVVFLRKAVPGAARSSYGIHAARLGGIPEAVLHRAQHILDRGLPLAKETSSSFWVTELYSPLEMAGSEALGWDPDRLSPREALDKIYDLKRRYPQVHQGANRLLSGS